MYSTSILSNVYITWISKLILEIGVVKEDTCKLIEEKKRCSTLKIYQGAMDKVKDAIRYYRQILFAGGKLCSQGSLYVLIYQISLTTSDSVL